MKEMEKEVRACKNHSECDKAEKWTNWGCRPRCWSCFNKAETPVETDARLFSAAPDLLAACQFVMDKCQLYGPADRAREMIQNAIDKATNT
jgi:hypothetical protein